MKPKLHVIRACDAGPALYGLYMALVVAPTEATMGDVQRIFYYHVPSAWVAFLCFFVNAVASVVVSDQAQPDSGRNRSLDGRGWRRVLHDRADHGADLGAPGMGHLVDVGCPADEHAGAVADLCGISDAAPIFRRRTRAGAGGGAGRSSDSSMCRSCISPSASSARNTRNR